MAKWAERLFWATVASLGLTLLGIFLIWRTLIHTRTAAKASVDMVVEAEKTTAAAIEAAKVAAASMASAREIGEAQVRAYLVQTVIDISFNAGKPRLRMEVVNSGNSPAFHCQAKWSIAILRVNEEPVHSAYQGMHFQTLRPGQSTDPQWFNWDQEIAGLDEELAKSPPLVQFNFRAILHYKDVFGATRSEIRNFGSLVNLDHDGPCRFFERDTPSYFFNSDGTSGRPK